MKTIRFATALLFAFVHAHIGAFTCLDNQLAFDSMHDYLQLTPAEKQQKRDNILSFVKVGNFYVTPSKYHLLCIDDFDQSFYTDAMAPVIETALQKEQQAYSNGHYVLYHSTRAENYAISYIDTCLCKLNYHLETKKTFPSKHILKLRQPVQDDIEDLERFFKLGFATQNKIYTFMTSIANGSSYMDHHPCNRYLLLSCNNFLFGNFNDFGECTFLWWAQNSNVMSNSFNLQKIFDQYIHLYYLDTYYENQLTTVMRTFCDNAKTGVLLQIIFKSEPLFSEYAYYANAGGLRREALINDTNTSDAASILKEIANNPVGIMTNIHTMQFRVILTPDKLLNITDPAIYNNFEVHPYALPQDALEEFHTTVNNIVHTIELKIA